MRYNNPSFKRRSRLSTPVRLGAAAVAACFISVPAFSNPVNPLVVNGAATFNQSGSVLTVTNSNGAVINWDKFSIQAGETTHFAQTSASSTVLNRVLNDPTSIYGTLSSNGRVWLVNPAGIMVGPGGRVDTAGFVASTLAVRNEDFLAARNVFTNEGGAGNVINQGEIKTPAGGSVYLIGSNVGNEGIITTPQGETLLVAGNTVSLIDSATPGVKVDITGAQGNATNLGTITAEAGRVGIAGVIVRNSGLLSASSVVNEGGRVFLKASQDAYVDGDGRIVTTGTRGGSVEVLGNRVALMDKAKIDASAISDDGDGGRILVGGDYQGKNPDIQNARITYFGPEAELKADAGKVGAGGTVIVWADDTTRAYGSISARGGDLGGDGGFVEVSGKSNLTFRATADVRAPGGRAGTVLLDPDDISIILSDATFTDELLSGSGPFQLGSASPGTVGATIGWNTIQTQLGLGSLSITSQTGGINFANGTYGWSNSNSLSLYSLGNIVFSGGNLSNGGSGALNLMAGWDYTSGTVAPATTGSTGDVQATNTDISTTSGAIKITAAGAVTLTNSNVSSGGTLDLNAQSLTVNAVTGNSGLSSQGNQTIALGAGSNGILQMTSTVGEAKISTNGSQNITFNGTANTLSLQGSNSATAYGGNSARIQASGTQSITKTSGSLAISLTGGSGTASNLQNAYKDGSVLICAECATFNQAQIESTGSQTISATTITVQGGGGSGGIGNSAQIESKGGTQSITTTGLISVTGGTGAGYYNAGVNDSVTSDASIHSDGAQTVNAGSINLVGGGDGTTLGGAFLSGKTSQSITTSGNLNMTGGSSTAVGQYGLGAPAIIGEETGANITLNIGGNLVMAGGAGSSSYALIGAAQGSPTINITAAGISMAAGGSASKIGVLTGGPAGSLSMTATIGSIAQDAVSAINTATLVALASAGSISFAGQNLVNTVSSLSASGNISYASGQSVHLGTVNSSSGNASLSTVGAGRNIFLGSIAGSTVTINAGGAIFDDNGSGVSNIAGNNIDLTSYGGSLGGLAISADINNSSGTVSQLNASVSSGENYGGIALRVTGDSPANVDIRDNAGAQNSVSFRVTQDFNLNGSQSFRADNGGGLLLGAERDVNWTSGGYGTLDTTGSAIVVASRNMTISGTSVSTNGATGGTLALTAGSTLDIHGTDAYYWLNVLLVGSSVTVRNTVGAGNDIGIVAGTLDNRGTIMAAHDLIMNVGNISADGGEGGGRFSATNNNIKAVALGNISLDHGARFDAGNDVDLTLKGADSTLSLSNGSYILANAPRTIHLDFTARASGGVFIDGVETTTSLPGGSGLFVVNTSTPAAPGAGLDLKHPPPVVGTSLDNDLNNSVDKVDPTKAPTTADAPLVSGTGGSSSGPGTPGTTTGGEEGSFGGDETGPAGAGDKNDGADAGKKDDKDEKDEKDKKKSDQAKDEKKDDKPAKKKLAQCTT